MKLLKILSYFFFIGFLFACDGDDPEVEPTAPNEPNAAQYENGFLIANEGPFQNGTGTVSFFDYSTNTVSNNVFQIVNNRPLGNILQSVAVHNREIFMVVNNANKVEVADAETFESIATIENLALPRHFFGVDEDKAYVSLWSDGTEGKLAVIDLNTYTVSSEITTALGPGKMMLHSNGELYVPCSGGFSSDDKVSIINTATDALIEDVLVGSSPVGVVEDKNQKIWVLCAGKFLPDFSGLEESGSLYKLDPTNNVIEFIFDFDDFQSRPSNLVIDSDGEHIFYTLAGSIYKMSVDATDLPSSALFSASLYGLGFDPESGYLIGSDAGDFVSNGKIMRYNPENGEKIDEFTVGVIPNGGFHFKENNN